MSSDGSSISQLTFNPSRNQDPSVSATGKIVFSSNRDGDHEIFIMNPDGSGLTQLTFNTTDDYNPSITDDGSTVVYDNLNTDIFRMNSDGSSNIQITFNPSRNQDATISRDGSIITFSTNRDGDHEIFIMGSYGGSQTQITTNLQNDYRPALGNFSLPLPPPPLLLDGSICTAGAQCQSNQCGNDVDGDNYFAAGTGTCQPFAKSAGDCFDQLFPNGAQTHPGQLAYFISERGDGSFDYNCDGSETIPPSMDCLTTLPLVACTTVTPVGNGGFVGLTMPGCGQNRTFRRCVEYSDPVCSTISNVDGSNCSDFCDPFVAGLREGWKTSEINEWVSCH